MKKTSLFKAFALTFVVITALNYVFHRVIAPDFFDARLFGLAAPIRQLDPVCPAIVYFMTSASMVWVTSRAPAGPSRFKTAILAGAAVGALTFGTWNLVNYGWIPGWPLSVVVIDTSWHVIAGSMSGAILAWALPRA